MTEQTRPTLEVFAEFVEACGSKKSWESGHTERLAKLITHMATQDLPDWNQSLFEGVMLNYMYRKTYIAVQSL